MKELFRSVVALLTVALLGGVLARPAAAQQRSRCSLCHSEMEYLRQNTDSLARARAVLVPDSTLANSAWSSSSWRVRWSWTSWWMCRRRASGTA